MRTEKREAVVVREVPHSDEMERAVLGVVLFDNRALATCAGWIATRDLYRPSHRLVWDAMHALHADGHPIDEMTLSDYFHARKQLDDVGGVGFFRQLSREVSSSANVGYYCREVKRYARLRELASAASAISEQALDPQEDPIQIAAKLGGMLSQQLKSMERKATVNAQTAEERWGEWFREMLTGDGAGGYRIGLERLDEICRGIVPGRSYYLGGLTKMGKTTFAIHIACEMVYRHGFALDYVSVEQTHEELLTKMLSWRTCIDLDSFVMQLRHYATGEKTAPPVGTSAWDALQDVQRKIALEREAFAQLPVWLTVEGAPDVRDIELMVRARQMDLESRGLDPSRYLLVVDYLQNIASGSSRHDDRERIAEVSRRLNGISKDLKMAVIVLFQFSQEAEKEFTRTGAMPRFSSLRGSSQAGNDANHLWILHRPKRDDEDPEVAGWTVISQELSRHGHLGRRVHLGCDLSKCRYWTWQGDTPDKDDKADKADD